MYIKFFHLKYQPTNDKNNGKTVRFPLYHIFYIITLLYDFKAGNHYSTIKVPKYKIFYINLQPN